MNLKMQERIHSIDVFRGLTIILMAVVNYLSGIACIPAFLKHAPDIGLTVTDLVAPAFIFAIGLTYKTAFDRRTAMEGRRKTCYHFITRYLAIAGIGAIFTGGAAIVSAGEASGAWGVLQAIGAAGLITLLFIRTETWFRFLSGFAMLLAYQILLDRFFMDHVLHSVQGGLISSFSWGALMLLSTALADIYHKQKKKLVFALISAAVLVAGLLSSFIFAVSKHRVSFSYICISAGAAACVFFLLDTLMRFTNLKLSLLKWWGTNPLILYIAHMVLLGLTFLPGSGLWYTGAPLWPALLQLTLFMGMLCLFAWVLYKKKIIIKI